MLVDGSSREEVLTEPNAERDGRLVAVLQDLIARDGRDAVAGRLKVSERTLRRAMSTGQLSRRLAQALEPYAEDADDVQLDLLKRQVNVLESRIAELEREAGAQTVSEDDSGLHREVDALDGRLQDVERQLAHVVEALAELRDLRQAADATSPEPAAVSPEPMRLGYYPRRIYPEQVHLEPRPDDEQVYGPAVFALVTEWRERHAEFKAHWPAIPGYEAEIRMVELEIELIGDHQLTLSSDEPPWPKWRRERELQERHARLEEARRKLRRKRIRRFVLRLLTLGLLG